MTETTAFRVIHARARRRRSPLGRWYRRNERPILSAAGIIAFVAAWQIGSDIGLIDKFFFSSPAEVFAAGALEVQKARFWEDAKISAVALSTGSQPSSTAKTNRRPIPTTNSGSAATTTDALSSERSAQLPTRRAWKTPIRTEIGSAIRSATNERIIVRSNRGITFVETSTSVT